MDRRNNIFCQRLLTTRRERLQRRRQILGLLVSAVATVALTYLVFGVVLGIALVRGESMTPNLWDQDLVLFYRLSAKYQTGDVVLVQVEGKNLIKRIAALPGQQVDLDSTGILLVDGEPLQESYIYEPTLGKTGVGYPLVLGEDEYFLLGDHRENSEDSRNFGPVNEGQILGEKIAQLRLGEQ